MGKYINQTNNGPVGTSMRDKCNALIADGATEIPEPKEFKDNLVCVVDNGWMAAAGYAFDEREMLLFADNTNDHRRKRWFIYPNAKIYAK